MEKIIQISVINEGSDETVYALTNKGNIWRGYPNMTGFYKWDYVNRPVMGNDDEDDGEE